MILIAESGSTKTDWRLLHNDESVTSIRTIGLNPFIVNQQTVIDTLKSIKIPFEEVSQLYFYGAGCDGKEKTGWLANILATFFVNTNIHVHSDLLASARALLGTSKGVIGILGTGSNVAYFDGTNIKPYTTSLGYLLGDEGSGNFLGKIFLIHYMTDKLDDEIVAAVDADKRTILNELYAHSFPNRYLASYSKIISNHKEHPQIKSIIRENFEAFITTSLLPFSIKSISFTGSVAHFFSDELKYCCARHNVSVVNVIEKPISQLCRFHIENK